jgi:predicted RNA binding protein YcfA (HicA-like mRNA interferase family)
VNGLEFIRRITRLGKARGVPVRFAERRGKGSHAMVYYGAARTVVKDRKKELGKGLLSAMLRDLGLTMDDIA